MEQEDKHFNKIFAFACVCAALGILYLFAITFIPLPKSSERFADNCQGFFQGSIIASAIAYLLGGNPTTKKSQPTIVQTGDNPVAAPVTPPTTDDAKV